MLLYKYTGINMLNSYIILKKTYIIHMFLYGMNFKF